MSEHPGEYLRDELRARNWSEQEFATTIKWPLRAVLEILNGQREITTEAATAIGEALGTSPDLWLRLQAAAMELE